MHIMGIPEGKEKGKLEIFETVVPKINVRHQTIGPDISKNTNQDKYEKQKLYLGISFSNYRKSKIAKEFSMKPNKKERGKKEQR